MTGLECQKTIRQTIFGAGKGLFTGKYASFKISPAPINSGIVFQRSDLPGKPQIPAQLAFVKPSPRCTCLASDSASIQMVEHLLSALYAMQIDNARIELDGPEIPADDGSSKWFVDLIEESGIECQNAERDWIKITEPIFWSEGEVHIVALPAKEFQISYTLHYPQSPLIKSQYYSLPLTPQRFKEEIAPSRTFSLYEEILPFIEKGIIKGGGLENALVIRDNQILNPAGARFPDEMVRHKILDLIGDLSLIGAPLLAHVIAIRSGHSSNVAFGKLLSNLFFAKLECC